MHVSVLADIDSLTSEQGSSEQNLAGPQASRSTLMIPLPLQHLSAYALHAFNRAIYPTHQSTFSEFPLNSDVQDYPSSDPSSFYDRLAQNPSEAELSELQSRSEQGSWLSSSQIADQQGPEQASIQDSSFITVVQDNAEQITHKPEVEVVFVPSKQVGESLASTPFHLNGVTNFSEDTVNLNHCAPTSLSTGQIVDHHRKSSIHLDNQESPDEHSLKPLLQVHVNDSIVAEFDQQGHAYHFAEAIKSLIASEDFQAKELVPYSSNERVAIAAGDEMITTSNHVTDLLDHGEDIVAIAWTNNLRTALGTEPLSMGEAQAHVQSLAANGQTVRGVASWYGPFFHGRTTASGEQFNQHELTAAHPFLPFGTYLNVTNLVNGRTVVVRINDRGPYIGRRTLDLSHQAAQCLGSENEGVVPYKATLLEPRNPHNHDEPYARLN